jgi:hypothetical protein
LICGIALLKSLGRLVEIVIQTKETLRCGVKASHPGVDEHRGKTLLKDSLFRKDDRLNLEGITSLVQILVVVCLRVRSRSSSGAAH